MTSINSFNGEHRFLSNFYPAPIRLEWDDAERIHTFPTTEHYYQFMKHAGHTDNSFSLCEHLMYCTDLALSPGRVKRLGRAIPMREDWEKVKLSVMEKALQAKFVQNIHLADKLIKTHPFPLIEGNNWGDTFWGVCNGEGENHLGKLLMKIRRQLINETALH